MGHISCYFHNIALLVTNFKSVNAKNPIYYLFVIIAIFEYFSFGNFVTDSLPQDGYIILKKNEFLSILFLLIIKTR